MTPEPEPDPKDPPKNDPPADPPKETPPVTGEFTAADKAALEAVVAKERKATRDAEKLAREAQAKLDAAEAEKLSDTDKLKKRAEDAEAKVTTATEKLRRANLLTALSNTEHGITDPRAAARLIEGVDFSDDDEPTNLADRITALKADYPLLAGVPVKPPAPQINGGGGGGGPENGPTLTAEELAAAKASGMTPEEFKHYQDPQAGPYVPAGKT